MISRHPAVNVIKQPTLTVIAHIADAFPVMTYTDTLNNDEWAFNGQVKHIKMSLHINTEYNSCIWLVKWVR